MSLACVVLLLVRAVPSVRHPLVAHMGIRTWDSPEAPVPGHSNIIAQLKEDSGRGLVIVRYNPGHNALDEWVYNEADIDHAKIVLGS